VPHYNVIYIYIYIFEYNPLVEHVGSEPGTVCNRIAGEILREM
jgi:hypothetical protein